MKPSSIVILVDGNLVVEALTTGYQLPLHTRVEEGLPPDCRLINAWVGSNGVLCLQFVPADSPDLAERRAIVLSQKFPPATGDGCPAREGREHERDDFGVCRHCADAV